MKVVRAKHSGVCYGVERALDMAVATLMDDEVTYTLGPLIHNPEVVSRLAQKGVHAVDNAQDIEDGVVVIRSHGVEPEVIEDLKNRNITVVDATCPHVAKAQRAAASLQELNGTVLVIGRSEHPEVKGLCGHARKSAVVIANADEIPNNLIEPVGIVVQTTESKEKLDSVVARLEERGITPIVKNTICFATKQRQESAARLAEEVDAIVVIGGKNSSNTTHLYEICKAHCPRSYFIESSQEINPSWFEGCLTVGVTAGASTPDYQISEVVEYLETL